VVKSSTFDFFPWLGHSSADQATCRWFWPERDYRSRSKKQAANSP